MGDEWVDNGWMDVQGMDGWMMMARWIMDGWLEG